MDTGKGKGIPDATCEAVRHVGNLLRGLASFSPDGVNLVCSTSLRSGELVENRTSVCPSHSYIEEGPSSSSALLFSEVADRCF